MKPIKAAMLIFAAVLCYAQEPAPATPTKYYRFDFVVKEVDAGKVQNAKNYSVIGSMRGRESIVIRAGEKVPVLNGNNATFVDVGVNVDCRILTESATELALAISADISSADSRVPPVITQTKWNSNVLVPIKKPT